MNEKRKNVRVTKKTDPMTFRFPLDFWEKLQKEHGVKTGNDAAIFFQKLYEQTFCPIVGVPTHELNVVKKPQSAEKIPDLDLNKAFTPEQKQAAKVVVTDQKGNELSDFMKRRQQSKLGNK